MSRAGAQLRRGARAGPSSSGTPRPTRPRTSAEPTRPPRWRSWPRSRSTPTCASTTLPYEGIDGVHAEDHRARPRPGLRRQAARGRPARRGRDQRARAPGAGAGGHRLAAVVGPDNAVLLESGTVRQIMLVGPGCRRHRDGLGGARRRAVDPRAPPRAASCRTPSSTPGGRCLDPDQTESAFYVRLKVADRPGVLAQIATVFAEAGTVDHAASSSAARATRHDWCS